MAQPTKPYRCKGSMIIGTACANEGLPEGVTCERCQKEGFTPAKKKLAIDAEKERTKNLPADRVKKSQSIKIEN